MTRQALLKALAERSKMETLNAKNIKRGLYAILDQIEKELTDAGK